jgi:hypothetical protein
MVQLHAACHLYHVPPRRNDLSFRYAVRDRKLSYWLVQLPLWRYLLTYFAIWLAVSYAGSSAATWTGNHRRAASRLEVLPAAELRLP